MKYKICVVGGGRWGENHIRTLYNMGNLGGIVENNEKRLKELLSKYEVKGFSDIDEAVAQGFNGYVVATPVKTHYDIGRILLENGCNTLIEKPMTLQSRECAKLIDIAKKNNVQLMVGHLLLFHPAIRKIKEIVDSGRVGQIYYLYSNRLNFGTVRTEENVLWSFAPHDIAVLDYIIGKPCLSIEACVSAFLQDDIHDIGIAHLKYEGNVKAHIFVSWLHPFKEQRLVVIGSKGMLCFDDSSEDKRIVLYNKHMDWKDDIPIKMEKPDEVIEYVKAAPLEEELRYFIDNLDGTIEIADGDSGYRVVMILEKLQESLDRGKEL